MPSSPTWAAFGPFSPKLEMQRDTVRFWMLVVGRVARGYCCDPSCLECAGCPFITEGLIEHFLLPQSSVPQRKHWFCEEGPTLHEQAHWPTDTFRHTQQHICTAHITHPYWLRAASSKKPTWFGEEHCPPSKAAALDPRGADSAQIHRVWVSACEPVLLGSHSDFSLKSWV